MATGSDLVLILGDTQSSDARQLSAQARETGARVQVIGAVQDVTPAMLADVITIGMAESISALAGLTGQIIAAIGGLGQLTVARRQVSTALAGPPQFAGAHATDAGPGLTATGPTGLTGAADSTGTAESTGTELAGTVR